MTMGLVTLVSGGLDSTLVAVLVKEEGVNQFPLFIDYGQICRDREWEACKKLHEDLNLPKPAVISLSGFGQLISSGLTDPKLDVYKDAFLPGRNLLFLLAGSAYAYQNNCSAIAIGLLSDASSIFPDQTEEFIKYSQTAINTALGREIRIVAPLMNFTKSDVIELAMIKGIQGTYSCHAGTAQPCGKCVSCIERLNAMKML